MFTSLQKIRILLDRKKRPGPRKNLTMVLATKNVQKKVVGKTCGETFGPVRFHGAGAGGGGRVRGRCTGGQDFARTAGSGENL